MLPALIGTLQLLGGLGILGLYLSTSDSRNLSMLRLLAKEKQSNMHDAASALLKTLRDATLSVEYFTPSIQDCLPSEPPLSNRSGETLLRTLGSLPDASPQAEGWQSIGSMQSSPNGTKWSWQIAAGFGCPRYMYAYIDGAIAPQFHGYCASLESGESGYRLNRTLAYNGTDWGFKDPEKALLNGTYDEVLMPVVALLGRLTCTYMRAVTCSPADVDRRRHHTPPKPFAITFADRSLYDLDAALSALRTNDDGVSFIVERRAGFLVAASVANQTTTTGPGVNEWTNKPEIVPQRVGAVNASDPTIVAAMQMVTAAAPDYVLTPDFSAPLLVTVERFAPMRGVDWLLVVAIPSETIVGQLADAKTKIIVVFLVVIFVSVLLAALGAYACVALPLRRIREALNSGQQLPSGWMWAREIEAMRPLLPRTGGAGGAEMTSARN